MTKSENVRRYILENYIIPARKKKERTITFSSAEIHDGMVFQNRYPLVCTAIDAQKFLEEYSVILVKREGPLQGRTVRWVFELMD